jgi:ketosteroid isomerase-like protein
MAEVWNKRGNMDERDNIQLVQQAYQAVAAGDTRRLLNLMAPDVVWNLPQMASVPFAGEWLGRVGVERFFATLAQSQEVLEFKPEQFVTQAGIVVAFGRFIMRVRATGRISRSDWAHVWTIEGHEITRFREYVDTAAVRDAYAPNTGV